MPASNNAMPMRNAIFLISNSRCAYCSNVIERKLAKMPGIERVAVSYLTDTVQVRYDPEKMTTEKIRETIKKLGYETIEPHVQAHACEPNPGR
jgi:copper chaperone CopZ